MEGIIDYDRMHFVFPKKEIAEHLFVMYEKESVESEAKAIIEQILHKTAEFVKRELFPYRPPPTTVVIVNEHPRIGISKREVTREPILWMLNQSAEENAWFLGHEWFETFVLHQFGDGAPRWLVETIAQIGAYRLCKFALGAGAERVGLEKYLSNGTLPFEELLEWRRPVFLGEASEEETYAMIEKYIVEEHQTSREAMLYATALRFGLERICQNISLGRLSEHLAETASSALFERINHSTGV